MSGALATWILLLISGCYSAPNGRNCHLACTDNYNPVCTSSGQTYFSKCHLDRIICEKPDILLKYEYLGECRRPEYCAVGERCNEAQASHGGYNDHIGPYCGSDGRNYHSTCDIDRENCRLSRQFAHDDRRIITVLNHGGCPQADNFFPAQQPAYDQHQNHRNQYQNDPNQHHNNGNQYQNDPDQYHDQRQPYNAPNNRVFRRAPPPQHNQRDQYHNQRDQYHNQAIPYQEAPSRQYPARQQYHQAPHRQPKYGQQNNYGPPKSPHGRDHPECPTRCPLYDRPVCGSDGNTYSNDCDLQDQNCRFLNRVVKDYDGPCTRTGIQPPKYVPVEVPHPPSLAFPCPLCIEEYRPVCGTNGRTYTSQCQLDFQACRSGAKISVSYSGRCKKASPSHHSNKYSKGGDKKYKN